MSDPSRPAFRQPRILGVLNITRDSFSDGGQFLEPGKAVEQGLKLWKAGADYVDIGAQATGPDAAMVSVDTFRPQVMLTAIRLGVEIINDVNGFRDPACIEVVAHSDAKLIVMHSTAEGPQAEPKNIPADGIVDRILSFFADRITALTKAGVERERIILDPGLGFFLSTDPKASVNVYRGLEKLQSLGLPICMAASRKSFIGTLLGSRDEPRPVVDRAYGSLACELFAATRGVQFIRTHGVGPLSDALRVWGALG